MIPFRHTDIYIEEACEDEEDEDDDNDVTDESENF